MRKQMKKKIMKFISVFTVVGMLCGSLDISVLAETLGKGQIIETVSVGDSDTVEKIVTESETDTTDYTYEVREDGTASITGYTGDATELVIPGEIDGYTVTWIGARSFYGCNALTSVTIPEGVKEIGEFAFAYSGKLSSITIPESVTEIGNCAFRGTSWLEAETEATDGLLIRNGILLDGFYAAGEVVIPKAVTEIAPYAFEECSELTAITISEGITKIGEFAFSQCYSLETVTILEETIVIEDYVFDECEYLTSIKIPAGVFEIGESICNNCYMVTIYGYTGSQAEYYAGQYYNLIFESIGTAIPATDISLENSNITMDKGEKITLNVTITPANTTDIIKWESSDTDVVMVVDGVVTAVGSGMATVTVRTSCGKMATCWITVNEPQPIERPAETVTLNVDTLTLEKGQIAYLTATMSPADATDTIVWSSSNLDIVTIFDGVVSAVAKGTADIIATATSGATAKCTITVTETEIKDEQPIEIPAVSITLDKNKLSLNKGETVALTATMAPANTTDIKEWTSSNPNVATVSSIGVVTAVGSGNTVITVKTTSGISAECVVTVNIPANKIKLNKTRLTLNKGKTYTLKATVTPSDSTDSIKWSSSKNSVAKIVVSGKKAVVTAVKKGTATITAKTSSGKKVTCKVTVKEIKATKIKLNKTKVTIKKGKSVTLKATLTPKNSTDTVKWTSSKKSVAKVSSKGKVTGVKKGTATITAKTSSGKKVTCKVTVK